MGAYNENHNSTLKQQELLGATIVNSLKRWFQENIDDFDVVVHIKELLDEALRETVGTTAAEKAEHIKRTMNDIFTVLENAGIDISDKVADDIPSILATKLTTTHGIFAEHKITKRLYTYLQLADYIADGGSKDDFKNVAIITPFEEFVVPVRNSWIQKTWGTYGKTVPNLPPQQSGTFLDVLKNQLEFGGFRGTIRLLEYGNPLFLEGKSSEVVIVRSYAEIDTTTAPSTATTYVVVEDGTTKTIAKNDIINRGTTEEPAFHVVRENDLEIGQSLQSYTAHAYYWDGETLSDRFVVPLKDIQNIYGCPAAEYAWDFKAYPEDPRQYFLPTIEHLLICYVYYTEINTFYSILANSTLPTSVVWTIQQGNTSYAYCVTIPSATVNLTNTKYNTYAVLPVAAFR